MKKVSLETRLKMSNAQKGKKRSPEAIRNSAIAHTRLKRTIETRKKMSKVRIGMKFSKEHILNLSKSHTPERRKKASQIRKGERSHLWKGGVCEKHEIMRKSVEYSLWREAVFKRDNWTCVWGGKAHGNKLHADHIQKFSEYPELRFAIDNGRTLCVNCHKKRHARIS